MIEKKCKICKRKFIVLPYRNHAKFCSNKCYNHYRCKGLFKKKCLTCKGKFIVPYYRRKTAKFCSPQCLAESFKLELIESKCNTCGKKLICRNRLRFKETKNHYCDIHCFRNRGRGAQGGLVIKYCNECGKKLIKRKSVVNMKDRKKVKTYHCSRKCLFRYQNTLRNIGPNRAEKRLKKLLRGTGFRFVGNFKVCIGNKCPDFISKRRKKVIEYFGEYWHPKSDEKARKKHFKKYGYKCLVIWGRDLKRHPDKINKKLIKFTK